LPPCPGGIACDRSVMLNAFKTGFCDRPVMAFSSN
jgi:hypothetical protein